MRITGGHYKGRKLNVPRGQDIRPTTDKVRQAVFNILLSYDLPEGAQVLDAFCGTGALGLEALSRGAAGCLFMDKRRESLSCTKSNIESLTIPKEFYQVIQKDSTKPGPALASMETAALAFFDPPYRMGLIAPALENCAKGGFLADQALCIIECEKQFEEDFSESFELLDSRAYGDIKILIARYHSASL